VDASKATLSLHGVNIFVTGANILDVYFYILLLVIHGGSHV
jgi:hypothetical protein